MGVEFVHVFPFFGRNGKHINKIPRKSQENTGTIPGQSLENYVYAFPGLFVFSPALKELRFERLMCGDAHTKATSSKASAWRIPFEAHRTSKKSFHEPSSRGAGWVRMGPICVWNA